MKKLLIINKSQFGYHIDTYYYCKYLRDVYDVTYICWDYGRENKYLDDVSVKYVSREGNVVLRNFRLIFESIKEVLRGYDIYFLVYFKGCSFLKIGLFNKKVIFDVRTIGISQKYSSRFIYNLVMKIESSFFEHISVISEGVAQTMKFRNYHILPLGADVFSSTDKTFNELRLLYIGSLTRRRIHETILGFAKFYDEFERSIDVSYTIIGFGENNEEQELRELVDQLGLGNVVTITGPVFHDEVKPFFKKSNVGVSYIPLTEYFDVQPPTKTFEYLLSGMPVIATDTQENRKVVSDKNGILISDNPDAFYNGLKKIFENRSKYSASTIRSESEPYCWETIVKSNLLDYLGYVGTSV